MLHLVVLVVGAAGFPLLLESWVQFVAVVAFVLPPTVPLVMPPPVQPVNEAANFVTGFTSVFELKGGRPGVKVSVPENSVHFGAAVFTAPPADELAVIRPTDKNSDIATSKRRPLRIRNPSPGTLGDNSFTRERSGRQHRLSNVTGRPRNTQFVEPGVAAAHALSVAIDGFANDAARPGSAKRDDR